MANKRIIDLEDSNQLDGADYIAIYNSEPSADALTYKRPINDVLALKTVSVNGVTGNTIVINADNISDTATAKKFTSATEKAKVAIIKTDLGSNVFLAGDGTYKSLAQVPEFLEVFMFNYMFLFPNRKYALANVNGSLEANVPTGSTLSGTTRFFWRVTFPENVVQNSVKIYDANNETYIASGLAIDSQSQNSGEVHTNLLPVTYNEASSHTWRIEFTTVNGLTIQSPDLVYNWVE